MRIAIIADIHANLEALKQVLSDIDASSVDTVVNLGDMIGYGPEPEEVVDLIRRKKIPGVIGNHELAVIDQTVRDQFTPNAQKTLKQTIALLGAETIAFFKTLPRFLMVNDFLCVHGCPPDSVTTYLHWLEAPELLEIFSKSRFRLCFVGHTHRLENVVCNKSGIVRTPLEAGVFSLDEQKRYIINAGSVGQPRDGNKNAKYIIWDDDKKTIETRFVSYDIALTDEKMIERGFAVKDVQRLLLAR